jgi:hypothetical protein
MRSLKEEKNGQTYQNRGQTIFAGNAANGGMRSVSSFLPVCMQDFLHGGKPGLQQVDFSGKALSAGRGLSSLNSYRLFGREESVILFKPGGLGKRFTLIQF